ncbi:MAG: hypothetical protein MUF22_00620 [Chitinispirillaceae bacterium]|jgi:tetratricopeptide (TPR) repeat protein|nr:hypothetical protein [Chitinispirillaceae bacterium]
MKRVVLLTVFLALTAVAETEIQFAKDLLARQDYPAARAVLIHYLKNTPDDIEAIYLRVAVEQTALLDYESYTINGRQFLKTADSVRDVLGGKMKSLHASDSLRCMFYRASILGSISVVRAKNNDVVGALQDGLASVAQLRDIRRLDPRIREALLGIGIYDYYLSMTLAKVSFGDKRRGDDGMKAIMAAATAPFPCDYAAKNFLCWIYIDRKEYARADSLASSVLDSLPDNTLFLRVKCYSAVAACRFEDARLFGERLSRRSRERQPVNWSDLVLAQYAMSSACEALGKRREACEYAKMIIEAPIPATYRDIPHVRKNLRKVRTIAGKCP